MITVCAVKAPCLNVKKNPLLTALLPLFISTINSDSSWGQWGQFIGAIASAVMNSESSDESPNQKPAAPSPVEESESVTSASSKPQPSSSASSSKKPGHRGFSFYLCCTARQREFSMTKESCVFYVKLRSKDLGYIICRK